MTEYFDSEGPTIQINLLGGRGFATINPENVEAVLSSQNKFESLLLNDKNNAHK
jgi:hypothetical protein